ncbi:hypothetical protein BDF20DRAFT_834174 [Mycotypha africana]|uniref:uncharacterized protein n=1 Tax=Mycotypha africana TaxID=64632 RepID=UPI0023008D4E|nr:uncharacterized protein BDF20DRAFT_834174 [Mycotypha africana]KAI8984687.1 hypothetical protein BDF20DRAFT_834174 [Mycotypha africana]
MSFLDGGGGADCGPANPMASLMKQFGQDRSIQQDRFGPEQRGESSKAAFRTRQRPTPSGQLTDGFFREETAMERPNTNVFQFNGLNRELERLQQPQLSSGPPPPTAAAQNWASDFMAHQGLPLPQNEQFGEFEKIYNSPQQAVPHHAWQEEFHSLQPQQQQQQQHHHQQQYRHQPALNLSLHERQAFERAFDEARQNAPSNWEQEFVAKEHDAWASEFEQLEKNDTQVTANNDNDALAKTAGMLLDSVDVESNPKFKNSQFMNLMRRLRDSEVAIEGDRMVETNKSAAGDWATQFSGQQQADSSTAGNMWSTEFASKLERGWTSEFHQEQRQHQHPGDWASEFSTQQLSHRQQEEMQRLFGKGTETEDWIEQYNKNIAHLKDAQDHEWDTMQKDWERFKPDLQKGLGYRASNPNYDTYHFAINNPYLMNPQAIDSADHGNLAESILALEAKTQLQTSDANAWKLLGLRQQENERDDAAIAALRQAVQMNPGQLDAWLALAVSYTNENCRADAYDALEQWLANNPKYQHLLNKQAKGQTAAEIHYYITNLFLEAARSSPGEEMDADVQVGLGVLFNVSEEYDKAIDCFKAAVRSRPQDYLLWNKLGATLANSRDTTGAIEAYFQALEISPTYVRARYNLAISCVNLGQQREAAEHLLTALAMQQANNVIPQVPGGNNVLTDDRGNTVKIAGGMSDNVWRSLRMLMLNMNRDDLARACDARNLNAFRADFEFTT